jgi:hypothetical protein
MIVFIVCTISLFVHANLNSVIGYVIIIIFIAFIIFLNKYFDKQVVKLIIEQNELIFVTPKKTFRYDKQACVTIKENSRRYMFVFNDGLSLSSQKYYAPFMKPLISPSVLTKENFPDAEILSDY